MRWPIVLLASVVATVAFADAPPPLQPRDLGMLVAQHRANGRAIALAHLAGAHGSPRLRVLGCLIERELGFIDGQVVALGREHGTEIVSPEDAWDRAAQDRMFRIAKLQGLAFDRALLAALGDELQLDLDWLDSFDAERGTPLDGSLATLFATMRPSFVRYRAEIDWLARLARPVG